MKILYSPASPYSAKVRMAAVYSGLSVESEIVKTDEKPELLVGNNPLGKIPVLLADGGAVFDSRAIMHFLDRASGGRLYPSEHTARTEAEVMEALGDGITDCLIAYIYEQRFHPPEKVHEPWLERQWEKVERGLDHLQAHPPVINGALHGGHFSIAAMIGYLALRFNGRWETRWPALTTFADAFLVAFPAYAEISPR